MSEKNTSPTDKGFEARRLDVPGTRVDREPVSATGRDGEPLRKPRPEERGPDGKPPESDLLSGEVPNGTNISNTWLRQRNLFAETRSLRDTVSRSEQMKVQLTTSLQASLMAETVASSSYRSCSAYLRSVATGRDRLAPIIAKAGALFFWTRACLGEKVRSEDWSDLRSLMQLLTGTEKIRQGLRRMRRHLRAGQLRSDGNLSGEEDLPADAEKPREKLSGFPEPPISVRLTEARKELIRENAFYSSYGGMSGYAMHMALGWDRNGRVLAQGVAIARWIESHLGSEIGKKQWEQLGSTFRRTFGVFLLGAGPYGETDVDGALRRGAEHLLGATLETVSEEA